MPIDPICGMNVNEKTGLKLTHEGQVYYFCSMHCLEKFKEGKKIAPSQCTSCEIRHNLPFYKNKTIIVAFVLIALSLLAYAVPFLIPFRNTLWMYIKILWWAILLGLIIGGIIDWFIPREYISHALSKPRKRTILYSVLLGFLMSACSHGILAISIELHKKGASNPAVVAFLLASPWANLTITIILFSFFGLKALYMVFGAIIVALITGLIFQLLERKKLIETNTNTLAVQDDFSIKEDLKERFKEYKFSLDSFTKDIKGIYKGTLSLSNMVLWWILIGMGLASLAGAYVPADFFRNYMGASVTGLLVTLFFATVIEICSEGSAPMAFEIFRQTGAFGNSFVFLMAGVVTDYTEIGLIWHNIGKKTAIWLPIVTVPQVLVLGILANALFNLH